MGNKLVVKQTYGQLVMEFLHYCIFYPPVIIMIIISIIFWPLEDEELDAL